jgi:hypothetical protein
MGATSLMTQLIVKRKTHLSSTVHVVIMACRTIPLSSSYLLRCSVADPDPGYGAFLTPGSGKGKNSGSRSGMNNPDHISERLETIFWVKIP